MAGGIIQLVYVGKEDLHLMGNPEVTLFKAVYRRHTNFSMECVQQTVNGSSQITTTESEGKVTVSREGELLHRVYVKCDQDNTHGINGDKLISKVKVEIGGKLIDEHTGEWLQIWNELTVPESKKEAFKYMSGGFSNTLVTGSETNQQSIIVPLQFWFCRNIGLALPVMSLNHHEVVLTFTWGTSEAVKGTGVGRNPNTGATPTCEVWCEYIFLDKNEKMKFRRTQQEYLIEQLQYQPEGLSAATYEIHFNHPVKEIIWTDSNSITNQKARLQLNNHDRFDNQDREYFQIKQPFDHHTAVPGYNIKEVDEPKLISPSIEIFNGRYHDTTVGAPSGANDGGVAILTNTNITFHADQLSSGVSVGDYLKVGDLLMITTFIIGMGVSGSSFSVVRVTSLTSTVVTFENSHINYDTGITPSTSIGITEFDKVTLTPTTGNGGDFIIINLIGRVQNPISRCSQLSKNINVYSFALNPEEHQPSGSCNFSKIDKANLILSSSATIDNIYAINYNILKVMSGMGGVLYTG
jgi:hypothetical protein